MAQCLGWALTCVFGQVCALFLFWGRRCDDTTSCATFSTSWCTETHRSAHASARLQTCNTMGRCFHDGYTKKFLPRRNLHTPQVCKFLWPTFNLVYWFMWICCVSKSVVVTYVLRGIWDVEFDANTHFFTSDSNWGKVRWSSGCIS